MTCYVLDACALIALIQNEQGANKVADAFEDVKNRNSFIIMNAINLLEVFYDVYRSHGSERAKHMITELGKLPVSINSVISDEIFTEAGRLKASYRISLADSIALAQTLVTEGELLTADHHEFDIIEEKEPITFHWIR